MRFYNQFFGLPAKKSLRTPDLIDSHVVAGVSPSSAIGRVSPARFNARSLAATTRSPGEPGQRHLAARILQDQKR